MSKSAKLGLIEASAFILTDLAGRQRAILVCGSPTAASAVNLALYDEAGRSAVTLSVYRRGRGTVSLSPRDGGRSLLLDRRGIELWRRGNTTAALVADADGGRLFQHGKDGRLLRTLPRR